mgnify:CR=1 FL=1
MDDGKMIHYGPDGRKTGESWVIVAGAPGGIGEVIGYLLFGVLGLFLLFFILMDKFSVLELGVEIFFYICAFRYFIKRRRYKRTGNEADRPSKFLRRSTKILIVLGLLYLALSVLSYLVAIIARYSA